MHYKSYIIIITHLRDACCYCIIFTDCRTVWQYCRKCRLFLGLSTLPTAFPAAPQHPCKHLHFYYINMRRGNIFLQCTIMRLGKCWRLVNYTRVTGFVKFRPAKKPFYSAEKVKQSSKNDYTLQKPVGDSGCSQQTDGPIAPVHTSLRAESLK
jgi:hypothetical protein